ncbi:MAG TPA: ABC transporter transmembrane domain-containing protein [Marmoricola sp.]|nr:ABC transporter transmembrane domain-containing protein [Marmoricola sp.]
MGKHESATGPRKPVGDLVRTARLFRQYMGGRKVYAAGIVFLVIEAATAVVEPYPIAYLIDYLQGARPELRDVGWPVLLDSQRYETILVLTLAIVLIAAINSAADSFTEVCMARGGRSLGYSIRVSMYAHLQRLPLAYHDKRRTGDVLTRVTGDVLVLEDFVVKSVSNILGSLLVLLGSFAFLLFQSWRVALVALVIVPVLAGVSNHYSRRIKLASKTQRDREGDLASTAQEMLTSIRLVQSYGRGTVDLAQFSDQTARSMHASLGAANIQAQFSFVIALMEALAISAVIWLGVWLFAQGALTIGTLVLFVLLLQNMFKPARKIVSEWYKIGKVFASVERIQDLLDREVTVQDLPDAVPAPMFEGRLTFRDVSFAYPVEHADGTLQPPGHKILDDVSFEVAPGEVVALIGQSGAGKSTIAQLVPRLYDPDEGEVLVDGHPLRGFTLASLREQVSVVLQETVLLSGTVAENIGYGIADATREDIEAAAAMANAHAFIMNLPEGYETILGERGSTLSGGQRQRLAIARAFIRRAPILILDEPTTGLDLESAQSVVGALRTLMQGTTTIVISHDPGLVRCADRVLVIGDGQIVEEGSPEALVRSEGPYTKLWAVEAMGGTRDVQRNGSRSSVPTNGRLPAQRTRATSRNGFERSGERGRLLLGLEQRLPGLARAIDRTFVGNHLERMLGEDRIDRITAGKLWLRDDMTCDIRYKVTVAGAAGSGATTTVLGRVHPDVTAAEAHVMRISSMTTSPASATPGGRSTWLAEGASMGLSQFPLDPELPTLPLVTDPAFLHSLDAFVDSHDPPVVTPVHHPREGACVLRYRLRRSPAHSLDHPPSIVYGKVYGDATGDVVDGFLRALRKERTRQGDLYPTNFPQPVAYDPLLRLLLTEGLPGRAQVPELLRSVVVRGRGGGGEAAGELRNALHQSARALAALHGSDLSTAPVYRSGDELARIEHEVGIVRAVWPQEAGRVMTGVDAVEGAVESPTDLVLSHGDFTPAQVLLDGPAPAVVDLDTLCWAEPALDLGRYLAHLRLLAVKAGGPAARVTADELGAEFLRCYGQVSDRTFAATEASDRIAFYVTTTLARSALHSCRQLKPERYELAVSLLEEIQARRVDL